MSKGFAHLLLVLVIAILFLASIGLILLRPNLKPINNIVSNKDEDQEIIKAKEFIREGSVLSDTNLNNPEIIKLPDGTYRMFVHRVNQMLSAKSTDGKKFTLESGLRLQGGMPSLFTLPNGGYRMYFNSFPDNSIKSATSGDGLTFKIEEGNRLTKGPAGSLDQGGIIHPSVLLLQNGTYKMYYDGVSTSSQESGPDSWNVMSATSNDGINWIKDSGTRITTGCKDNEEIIEDNNEATDIIEEDDCLNGAWNVNARLEEGKIVLYFSADVDSIKNSGIWKASSSDGLSFTVEELILGQEEAFSGKRIESGLGPKGVPQDPFILETSDGLRLFYWTPEDGILSAVSN